MKWCLCQVLVCSRRSSFTSSHLHLWGWAVLCHSILYLCSISLTGQRSVGKLKSLKPSRNPQSLWKPDIVFGLNTLPDQGKLPANRIFGMKWNINFKAWKQVSCPSQMPSLAIVGPPYPAPLTSVEHQSPTPQVPSTGEHLLAVLCSEKCTNKSLWSRGQMCLT